MGNPTIRNPRMWGQTDRARRAALHLLLLAAGAVACSGAGPVRDGGAASPGLAASDGEPAFDSQPPPVVPERPGGTFGHSRYVFAELDGQVVTTLVEGPRGRQVRCQREELPCSYLELSELYTSGAPVPPELGMTREELGALVDQLDRLAGALARYEDLDRACADGYRVSSEQNPNMGIHMTSWRFLSDGVFDPAKPEMLLFAMEGGETLSKQELGDCEGGVWTGDPRQRVVGAAFVLPTDQFGEDHPEGFAGPIDNWHVHYYSCVGTRSDAILTPEQCERRGGKMVDKAGWMIHAYAQPEFDSQAGVFAMFNPSIWPVADPAGQADRLRAARAALAEGEELREIESFSFGGPIQVEAGSPFTLLNGDNVPHTVTAGTPGQPSGAFDSGALGRGETFSASLQEPGEYPFFCTYHAFMTGTVVVRQQVAGERPAQR